MMPSLKLFGRAIACGHGSRHSQKMRVEYVVDACPGGFKVTGTVRGKPGRLEVFRGRAPREFLLNNWQSWGPLQKMRPGEKHRGIEEIMSRYSPYVFTPIPEIFRKNLVSDYFIAWPGFLAGFLASKIAHPYFVLEDDEVAGYLEFFDTAFAEPVPLEPLLLIQSPPDQPGLIKPTETAPDSGVETLLETYAGSVAVENGARVPHRNPVGWSSWYQYFANLQWSDIQKNLRLAGEGFPFQVFQVDDGYAKDIGDWLDPKEGFGRLPDLAAEIAGRGFEPGIWTAPFSAAESSRLFRDHADWMVGQDGRPKVAYRNWGKNIYALDCTRPEALGWIEETFSRLRGMGFAYFKVDFLFAAAIPGERVGQGTPIEAYRKGMTAIRRAVGNAFLLGCGAPLLPSAGFVEGMRIGEDTAPFWDTQRGAFEGPNAFYALKNSILRSFLHRRLWLNDPDCLLLRSRDVSLTANEKELFALAAGALDNMIIESDDLALVDERGRELLRRAIALRGGRTRVRELMDDGFYRIESRGGNAGDVLLLANLSDQEKVYLSTAVPPHSARLIPAPDGY